MTGRAASTGAVLGVAVALAATAPAAGGGQPVALVVAAGALVGAALCAWLSAPVAAFLLAGSGAALGVCTGGIPGADGAADGSSLAVATAFPALALAGAAVVPPGRGRWLVLLGGAIAGPVRALVYDPFLDPACDRCRPSTIVVWPDASLARLALLSGCLLAVLGLFGALREGAPRPAVSGVIVAVVAVAAGQRVLDAVVLGVLAATVQVALGGVSVARARSRLRRLAGALVDPTALEDVLREASGDGTLRVDYRLEHVDGWIRADGSPAEHAADRSVVLVQLDGEPVARVVHAGKGVPIDGLLDGLDLAGWIALENVRLAAGLTARVAELSASRARIVARADAERRAIERDVHDGAQQHVIALAFDLRVALAAASNDEREDLQASLEDAQLALDDLRDLSHGLYPPVLASGGLAPAVSALARRAAVPITVARVVSARLDPVVERLAYALVDAAADGDLEGLVVLIDRELGGVRVEVTGVGAPKLGVLPDRVAALGGTLVVDGGRMEAVIPCA
jgi:signal transduction histidine kinase